ncbi:MAG: hypothetical protein GX625_02915, partial [Clostridiaceae bacterium]|nr:hypothetical protein [Clostridiaceae bacterium]
MTDIPILFNHVILYKKNLLKEGWLMKMNLTIEDLKSLTFSQKQTLNSLWLPEKYDRAVASVCQDAENDIYEDLEFVVGEVILSERANITLKRLRLSDDLTVGKMFREDEKEVSEEDFYDYTLDPGDFFLKENCLPL